jgi:hypothetical protein
MEKQEQLTLLTEIIESGYRLLAGKDGGRK